MVEGVEVLQVKDIVVRGDDALARLFLKLFHVEILSPERREKDEDN